MKQTLQVSVPSGAPTNGQGDHPIAAIVIEKAKTSAEAGECDITKEGRTSCVP